MVFLRKEKRQWKLLMEITKDMKDIAIYGAGGFGREVACLLNIINKEKPTWHLVGFFDDGYHIGESNKYGKILGGLKELNKWSKPISIVIAIANPNILENISDNIINKHVIFPNIIAPNILFFEQEGFEVGHGNIITFGCRMSCNITIGNFNILNGNISFGHDVKIGSYNVMQPETRISGETTVGNNNFFGARSLVLQRIKIGNYTRIGAASVVMRNTKDNNLYFGNPAKILKNI